MRSPVRTLAVGLVLLLPCGCYTFTGTQYDLVSPLPGAAGRATKKSISVLVAGEAVVNGKETEVSSQMLNTWREQTVRAYQDQGSSLRRPRRSPTRIFGPR